jgi:hypothetical protein
MSDRDKSIEGKSKREEKASVLDVQSRTSSRKSPLTCCLCRSTGVKICLFTGALPDGEPEPLL